MATHPVYDHEGLQDHVLEWLESSPFFHVIIFPYLAFVCH